MNFLICLIYNCLCIIIIGIISGLLLAAVPSKVFKPGKRSSYNDFKFEQNGRFYEKHFKITLWKGKVPQFSEIVHRGFSKDSLKGFDRKYMERFYLETIRAEFCHRLLMVLSPIFCLLNTDKAWGITVTTLFFLGNIPFIMIQRYNRPRIKKILDFKEHKSKIVN